MSSLNLQVGKSYSTKAGTVVKITDCRNLSGPKSKDRFSIYTGVTCLGGGMYDQRGRGVTYFDHLTQSMKTPNDLVSEYH